MFNKKKVMRNSQKQKTMTHTWGVRGGDGEQSLAASIGWIWW